MKLSRKVFSYSIAIIVSLCCICLIGAIAINSSGSILSTPTPALLLPQSNLSTIIAQTASVAQTQTMFALPPTPLSTVTLTSTTIENNPTATNFISELQTEVVQPTNYIFLTNTPFTLATQPALPPQSAICSCSGDTLNCDDFNSQTDAQACMDYCIAQGAGDIHHLDNNNNGIACEEF